MHFQFTGDQVLFRDAVRELLEKECPAAHVRAMWESASGRSPELWDKLVKMGVVGLTVPEEHGGLGLDEVDLVLLLEETGRAALPEPIVETTAGNIVVTQARWVHIAPIAAREFNPRSHGRLTLRSPHVAR